ncbi:uncharacterized protein [Pyxicephalus adspersus]|uniref:uncharacterized protein n=1 Tax=Pyxicephalus adspersus TaxID=30357 RepID=UPI003B5A7FE8
MWRRFLILLTVLIVVETSVMQRVHGQYGSDLHLRLSKLCKEQFFDVNQGETQIGNYHDGTLQGFEGFKDRLDFFDHNCTFIIRKFSEADGNNFTFTNYGSVISENFEITITAASSISKPTVAMNTSLTDNGHSANTTGICLSGFFALGFCLDPLIGLIIIFLAIQIKETSRSEREIASYTQKVVGFIRDQYLHPCFGLSCFFSVLSLVCWAISLFVLVPCGSIHEIWWIVAAVLLALEVVVIAPCLMFMRWKESPWNKILSKIVLICMCIGAVTFPIFIYTSYYSHYTADVTHLVILLIVFFVSSVKFAILSLFSKFKSAGNINENTRRCAEPFL